MDLRIMPAKNGEIPQVDLVSMPSLLQLWIKRSSYLQRLQTSREIYHQQATPTISTKEAIPNLPISQPWNKPRILKFSGPSLWLPVSSTQLRARVIELTVRMLIAIREPINNRLTHLSTTIPQYNLNSPRQNVNSYHPRATKIIWSQPSKLLRTRELRLRWTKSITLNSNNSHESWTLLSMARPNRPHSISKRVHPR